MADTQDFKQVVNDAILDADSLEKFINGSDSETVLTRLSAKYPTLQKALKELFENSGIAGRFKTLAELQTSDLVDGDYALVADDATEKNGIYIKEAGSWVKSAYDPVSMANTFSEKQRKLGENNVNRMRPTSPYYEKVGLGLYFKFNPDGGGACFTVYDKRYPTTRITLTQFKTMMETIPADRRGVTSPSGVEDCYLLYNVDCIVFNHDTRELEYRTSGTEVGNFTIIVANSYSDISSCTEEFYIRQQMLSADINKTFAPKSLVTSSVNHGSNAITNMWFIDPHYEMHNNLLYFKPSTYLNTDFCFYVRDARYSNHAITLGDFYTQLEDSGILESRFKITSPSGVEDCVVLAGTTCIFYDIDAKRFIWGDRSIKGNYVLLVGNDGGQVAKSLEEPRVYNKLLQTRINAVEASIPDSLIVKNEKDANIKAVAHRGYSSEAPENTLPAYILAKKKGYHYVETDVQMTADGELILLHDQTIGRTSNGTGVASEMTLAQLKEYDFGIKKGAQFAGTEIPTLEEFLKLCYKIDLHPYLEMKFYDTFPESLAQQVIDVVKNTRMTGKVTYIGSVQRMRVIKSLDPTARLGNVTTATESNVDYTAELKTTENEVFLSAGHTGINQDIMDYALDKGISIEAWTVNDVSEALRIIDLGVSGVTTDTLNIQQIINDSVGL